MTYQTDPFKQLNIPLIACLLLTASIARGQGADTTDFRQFDIFPAISYSPETKLTIGVLGFRYLDLSTTEKTTRSYINFLALYTTANQAIVESGWDLFTNGNRNRIRGSITFSRFPNRNYGLGNEADAIVTEYSIGSQGVEDSVLYNYKRYSLMRVRFEPALLWEIKENFYGGFLSDVEFVWNYEQLADSVHIRSGEEDITLLEQNTLGLRSGLGVNLVWDSRDYLLNCGKGSYLYLHAILYGPYLWSDYTYSSILLDTRKYLRGFSNHTLAVRGLLNFRFTNDETLPLRGLSRVGGSSFVRGYFQGTFQNNHVVGFQAEYRIPFWNENRIAPFRQFWKRLGMTLFASGGQAYGQSETFKFNAFNFAAGGGLRILFNEDSRANLRIDYAFGLSENSNGPGRKQTGLYFIFGEAF